MFRVLALGLLATGCSAYDLTVTGEFRPSPNGFEFKSIADAIYPLDSPKAEAKRIARLEQYLAETGLCADGYQVSSRQPVKRLGNTFDIFYRGECL